AVYPTPTIGMVGVLASSADKMTLDFKKEGDLVYLLGKSRNDINSSEYLHKIHNVEFSPAPHFDLEEEWQLHQLILELISKKLINAAHDCSEGGIFIALLECGFFRNLGFSIQSPTGIRKDAFLFGEAAGRVLVTVEPSREKEFLAALQEHPRERLGAVSSSTLEVDGQAWGKVEDWKRKYDNAIAALLQGHESEHALSAL
ncbi:MAG TPA: AIR synthase-related protein, partial [Chitinophagaceae bacterium]|nr:AIR synthase-related protein [Chitinophagaceae bacterium]